MRDIIEAYRRELIEILYVRSARKQAIGWIVLIIMFGVFIPMSQSAFWLKETQLLSLHFIFIPLMITYACVASRLAGIREYKPESFIGKGLASFVFSYSLYLFIAFTGILSLNYVLYMNGQWNGFFIYSPPAVFTFVIGGAGLVVFAIASGALISIKANSVKTAQLMSSVIYLFIGAPVLLEVVKIVFVWDFVLPVTGVLFVIDAVLLAITMRMYRKSRYTCESPNSIYDS